MRKIAAVMAPVVALCLLGGLTDYQVVSLWVILFTLPVAVVFIAAYVPERPWRSWFGTSLLQLAVGVTAVGVAAMLFRLYGLDYPLRELIGMFWVGMMFVALVVRTWVLLASQWRDRIFFGGSLRRLLNR